MRENGGNPNIMDLAELNALRSSVDDKLKGGKNDG